MRLPSDTQRVAVVGRTGSGKTVMGVWLLSKSSYARKPWIVLDFKRDKLIGQIPAKELKLGEKLPTKPGIYVVRPLPHQEDEVEELLWRVYSQENVGVYVDEGYMLKDSKALLACLTQGRSKHIPMIILSQRPVRMNLAVFTEADFFSVFHLNYSKDRIRVIEYIGDEQRGMLKHELPEFHSLWYDVGQNELTPLLPVPAEAEIVASFEGRNSASKKRKVAV